MLHLIVTSPQSNRMAESFVKTLKRDYAKLAERTDLQTVIAQLSMDQHHGQHVVLD